MAPVDAGHVPAGLGARQTGASQHGPAGPVAPGQWLAGLPSRMTVGVVHRNQPYGQGDHDHERDDDEGSGGSLHVGTSFA